MRNFVTVSITSKWGRVLIFLMPLIIEIPKCHYIKFTRRLDRLLPVGHRWRGDVE
jgi:hypothetical protein